MNDDFKNAIEKLKEVKERLKNFLSREEAIKYLMEETKQSQRECSAAYDFFEKIDFSKDIDKLY